MLSQFGTNYDCGYPTYQQPFCSREIRWRRAYFRKFLEFFPIFWKYPLYLSWYKGRQGNTLVLLLLSQSYLADHSTPTPILAANLLRPNLSQIVVFIPVRHIPARRVPYRAEKSRLYATYNWIGQSDTFRMCWAKRRVRRDIFTKRKEVWSRWKWSDQHQHRKQSWQGCGRKHAYGYNDTCAGYTSQSRAPRHKHGGRHNNPMERLCPPPSEQPLHINCENLHPHRLRCGFCHKETQDGKF